MNDANPYAPPRAAVSDVASPEAGPELAGRGARLGAYLVDWLIILAVIFLPPLVGAMVSGSGKIADEAWLTIGLLMLVGSLALIIVTTVLVVRNGQTIAKRMFDIKVVRTDGSKASLARIFWLRTFVNYILGLIPAYQLVDPLLIFSDSRQCVHDKLADTIVVVA